MAASEVDYSQTRLDNACRVAVDLDVLNNPILITVVLNGALTAEQTVLFSPAALYLFAC